MKISNEYYNFLDPSVISASFGGNGNQSSVNMGDFYLKTLYIKNDSTSSIDSKEITDSGGTYNFKGSSVNTNLLNTDTSSWTDAYFKQDSLDMLSTVSLSTASKAINYVASVSSEDNLNHGITDGTLSSSLSNAFTLNYYWPAMIWLGNYSNGYKAVSDASFIFDNQPWQFDSDLMNGQQNMIDISQLKPGFNANAFPSYGLYIAIPVENTDDSSFSIRWKDISDTSADWRMLPNLYYDASDAGFSGLDAGYFPGDATGFTDSSSLGPSDILKNLTEVQSVRTLRSIFSLFFDSDVPATRIAQLSGVTSSAAFGKQYKVFRFPLTSGLTNYGITYSTNARIIINYNNRSAVESVPWAPSISEIAFDATGPDSPISDKRGFFWLYPKTDSSTVNYTWNGVGSNRKQFMFWDDIAQSSNFGKPFPYLIPYHSPAFGINAYWDTILGNDSSYQSMISFYNGVIVTSVPNSTTAAMIKEIFQDVSSNPALNINLYNDTSNQLGEGITTINFGAGAGGEFPNTGFDNGRLFEAIGSKGGIFNNFSVPIPTNFTDEQVTDYVYNPIFNYANLNDSCTYIRFKIKDSYRTNNKYQTVITKDTSDPVIDRKYYCNDIDAKINTSANADGTVEAGGGGIYVGLPLMVCGCVISNRMDLSLNEVASCIRKMYTYSPEMSYGQSITTGIAMTDTSFYSEYSYNKFPSPKYQSASTVSVDSMRHMPVMIGDQSYNYYRYVSDPSTYCMFNSNSANFTVSPQFKSPFFYLFAAINQKYKDIGLVNNVIMNVEMESDSLPQGQVAWNTINFQRGSNSSYRSLVYYVSCVGYDTYFGANSTVPDSYRSSFTLANNETFDNPIHRDQLGYKFFVASPFRYFASEANPNDAGYHYKLSTDNFGYASGDLGGFKPIKTLTITDCWFDNSPNLDV